MKNLKHYFKSFTPSSVDEEAHTVRVRMTTEDVDRHGEQVMYDGWDFTDFLENPAVLVNHNDYELPVGRVIEIIPVPDEKAYDAIVEFDVDDEEGARVWGKVSRGFLNTVSVGFINLAADGAKLLENALLELSFVTIPANPKATVRSMKDGTMTVEDATWLKEKAEAELKHLTKFLQGHKVKDNSGATMNKDEAKELITELLKPIVDDLAALKTAAENTVTKDDLKAVSDTVDAIKADTKPQNSGGHEEHNDEDELTDEEAQAILDEFNADLDEKYPGSADDKDDE